MTIEEKAKWFNCAIKFSLEPNIFLEMKSKINGKASWAINNKKTNQVLNSNLEWENEPEAGKRDGSFLTRTRFDFEMAVQLYEQYKEYGV